MTKTLRAALAASSLLFFHPAAQALDVAGTHFDDQIRLGGSELLANGGGLRSRFFIKVYAAALYLPQHQAEADAALAAKGPKRIAIVLLRDLSAHQFVEALQEGIARNASEAELAALKDRLEQFSAAMLGVGEAARGTVITLDWLPESGTRLSVGGRTTGRDIAGEDFYRALLRIWLGPRPVQNDLKQGLLGHAG